MKILLGFTGSVASLLAKKIIQEFAKYGHDVKCICTEHVKAFAPELDPNSTLFLPGLECYTEKNEWEWNHSDQYQKGDKVLHIELAQWCDVMCVLADANTIGKMVHGISDNLLVSAYLALPPMAKKVVAPAMNTNMWFSNPVQRNIEMLKGDGCIIVDVDYKMLACGSMGYGALAPIFEIVAACDTSKFMFGYIPMGVHPGAFGVKRRHHYHTGVDLYVHRDNAIVYPFENGEIVSLGPFTGTLCGSPWWNDTSYVAIKHGDFVVVYGEIKLRSQSEIFIGRTVTTKDSLGSVVPVTKNRHPEYPYHNNKMLHVELHKAENFDAARVDEWEIDKKQPGCLLDPTDYVWKHKKDSETWKQMSQV